jgi:predicted transcriptional regulator
MSQLNAYSLRRRSTIEMDIAILQALSGSKPLKITHIMCKANLNANVLKAKLIVLEEKGLINSHRVCKERIKAPSRVRMFYGLTSEGLGVLHSYRSVYAALGSVEP